MLWRTKVSNKDKQKILRLYAEIGQNFNGYYHQKYSLTNLLDSKNYDVIVNNQFLSVRLKFNRNSIKVAYWILTRNQLEMISGVVDSFIFGPFENRLRFFLPTDLFDIYPSIINSLSEPSGYCEGIMTPSGRSLWVFSSDEEPICLKIDTFLLSADKKYNARRLDVINAQQSILVSTRLKQQKNIFSESQAVCLLFDPAQMPTNQKQYNYLVRTLDFEKVDVRKNDYLLPIHIFGSDAFWQDQKLIGILELKSRDLFFKEELHKAFADLIKNCLSNTFIHYELHQQNLTAHLRDGRLVKLIYHDMLDVVFDPITYLLDRFTKSNGSKNSLCELLLEIKLFQEKAFFNSHGHFIDRHKKGNTFLVSSFYRRYLRNFGDFTKTYNVATGDDYFNGRQFEKLILKHLNFSIEQLGLDKNLTEEQNILKDELFWCIDRFQEVLQSNLLQKAWSTLTKLKSSALTLEEEIANLQLRMQNSLLLCSNNFPFDPQIVDFSKITEMSVLLDQSTYIGIYDKKPFLIIVFSNQVDVSV